MADAGLAHVSDNLLFGTVVLYALAMLAYAAEFAFARRSAVSRLLARVEAMPAPALVGGGPGSAPVAPPDVTSAAPPRDRDLASLTGRAAVALTAGGWVVHVASVATRGAAVHRVPWGNMYEFSSAVTLAAVGVYLVLLARYRVRYLGVFVMFAAVIFLGLAGTVLYVQAGPLVPALNSYWIKIHVVAAVIASGSFMLAAVITVLYLLRRRADALVVASRTVRLSGVARLLPAPEALDRTAYRVIAFAFPVWTFAIVAGAIWAESAWGRYWGWDPKETWSFITWVVYAGYLHARTTAGWKGGRAGIIALIGFAALMFDFYGVNIWFSGLHSYGGVK